MNDLDPLLHRVPRSQGRLRDIVHLQGVMRQALSEIDPETFRQRLQGFVPTKGNGDVWYLDDEHHADGPPTRERVLAPPSPLPPPIVELQWRLLERLHHERAHGWSCVTFWTEAAHASVGAHVDNEDVYTIQLIGRKRWEIEAPDRQRLRERCERGQLNRFNPSESWVWIADDVAVLNAPRVLTLEPGDFLAMPAFALHRVESLDGPTLACNVSVCQEQDWASVEA